MTPRSSLITQRRVREAWTLLIILAVLTFAALIVGFILGLMAPRHYKCPEISGAQPVSTIDSKAGQTCLYVRATDLYGKAIHEVKL